MCAKPGNVLILADGQRPAERLGRWVSAAGEQPVLVYGADTQLFERGDDRTIDLVVTDLDPEAPDSRRILDNLYRGELFVGVPQLHVQRDSDVQDRLAELSPDAATVTLPTSTEPVDFQARVRLAAEVGKLRREICRLAIRDDLTQTHNRRFVTIRLEQEVARARRHETLLALVLFEIDDLDAIRARHGTRSADGAILHVSEVLRAKLRKEDVLGRWGVGSFAAILPGAAYRGAATFANHVRGEAEAPNLVTREQTIQVRISAGIAAYGADRAMESEDDLVRAAERALGEAKDRGGNRVFIDESLIGGERPVILIADSDSTLLDPAEDLLTLDDYQVIRAETPTTLLEAARERRPDLLILDLQLGGEPVAEPALVDRVQELYPDNPVPIVGLAQPTAVRPSRVGGRPRVDRYLTKPFSVSVLRSIAHDLLGHASMPHGRRRDPGRV